MAYNYEIMKLWHPILTLLILCGCVLPTPQSRLCEDFFSLPTRQEQYKQFESHPIEAKLEIYFCGMKRHPHRRDLADEIAINGDSHIAFLLSRLKAERTAAHKSDIIYIFEAMARWGHLDGRLDILRELENTVNQMDDKMYRERSQESLNTVKQRVRGG